jgi:hypothetical protein
MAEPWLPAGKQAAAGEALSKSARVSATYVAVQKGLDGILCSAYIALNGAGTVSR